MPRILHTAIVPKGAYGDYSVANAADYTYLAADTSNKEEVVLTGKELLLVRNVHATTPFTITINSVDDQFNRKEDVTTYSLGALEFAMFGPFLQPGWRQTNGKLNFEGSDVSIEFAVIKLP